MLASVGISRPFTTLIATITYLFPGNVLSILYAENEL